VEDIVFQGPSALTLDSKGRLAVPTRHRDLLSAAGVNELTITLHPDDALMIFPRPTWLKFRERLVALPFESSPWKRMFLGNAMDVEIDASSRVLIAPELRDAAGLVRDVKLIGVGSHLELWDAQRHIEQSARTKATAMPDSIKAFVF
jgi:MraZ protein